MPKYDLDGLFDPDQTPSDDAHSQIMRLIPPGSQVLELGCATGYLSGYMEQMLGCRVIGLEYDKDAVAVAKTRCHAVYEVDLDSKQALEPAAHHGLYEVLLAAAVLEHLKHPVHLLSDARRLLAPGAKVIVSLPNIAHWSMRLNLLMGRFDYMDYGIMDRTHLHFYTLESGQDLLEDAGYNLQEVNIAGSGLQNVLNGLARSLRVPKPPLVLPSLLAYEIIFVAS
jgi:methionine biosynthesis protein MetW